jgi:endoglycosylceramidase
MFAGRSGLLGYDVINEPWPGSAWQSCANPAGCPPGGFDDSGLDPMYAKVIPAIRTADRRHLVIYEPNLLFDYGSDTQVDAPGDSRAVFGFHNYCLSAVFPGVPTEVSSQCGTDENLVFGDAEGFAERTGDGLLMGEWGGASGPADIERITAAADRHLMPWMFWAYGRVIPDPKQPPKPPNLDPVLLDLLVRPYPQAVAGTPLSYFYDPDAARFELHYSTTGPTGQTFEGRHSALTRVFIPRLHFGKRYDIEVSGARVVRSKRSQRLRLRARRGAHEVSVTVRAAPM